MKLYKEVEESKLSAIYAHKHNIHINYNPLFQIWLYGISYYLFLQNLIWSDQSFPSPNSYQIQPLFYQHNNMFFLSLKKPKKSKTKIHKESCSQIYTDQHESCPKMWFSLHWRKASPLWEGLCTVTLMCNGNESELNLWRACACHHSVIQSIWHQPFCV